MAAGGLMPEVMEVQILDAEDAARSGECSTDALSIKGKDVLGLSRLSVYDCPGLWRVLEASVIAFLVPRMLRIPHQAGPTDLVVVDPFEAGDFGLSPRRSGGEVHDGHHGEVRPLVTRDEVVAQLREFLRRRSPRALARFADEAQRCARFARLLRYLRAHRDLLDVARGPQHDANPNQIAHDRRRSCAVRTTAAHVANQRRRGEFEGIYLTDLVVFEELEMALLASLPFGNRLEGLDVPADERGQRNGHVLHPPGHGLVFELHFAVLGPACGRGTLRKSPVLLLDQRSAFPDANDRCVARGTVGLSACSYLCHIPNSEGSSYS
jgi:hypothetical protein